jgi:hypothetical protein
MAIEEGHAALIVCDRSTLDGLAYWPGSERESFEDIVSTRPDELERYATVIHMRTPPLDHGYMPSPFRIESARGRADRHADRRRVVGPPAAVRDR